MSCRANLSLIVSVMRQITEIAPIVGSVTGVICAVCALWTIYKAYKHRRGAYPKERGSEAIKVMIVISKRPLIVLVIGIVLIAFGIGGIPKLIDLPERLTTTSGKSFPVMANYHPSGLMGDIGDLKPTARMENADQFKYEPLGRGPHEWDYKYVNGILNEKPAQFAGVMYLHPRGNFGTDAQGGHNLSNVSDILRWEARSVGGEVYVEFVIGGITWTWDEAAREREPAPFPDSLPHTSLGTMKLTTAWQAFSVDLRGRGRDADDFKSTIGGFGWVITWAANGVELDEDGISPKQKKVFTIEIRNIRYERK